MVPLVMGGRLVPLRHRLKRYGDARFAGRRELARMRRGLELGLDRDTGHAVRIAVEGNLITIAPPRTGKTGGLILPNLALLEPGAWGGPVVVIDPKGDALRAARGGARRSARLCASLIPSAFRRLRPLGSAARVDPEDVLELQSMARALLPDVDQTTEGGTFFRDRAVVLIVAALQS